MSKYSKEIEKYISEMIFLHLAKSIDEASCRIRINAYLQRKHLKHIPLDEFASRVRNAKSMYQYHIDNGKEKN
jgi:hypothetical protein